MNRTQRRASFVNNAILDCHTSITTQAQEFHSPSDRLLTFYVVDLLGQLSSVSCDSLVGRLQPNVKRPVLIESFGKSRAVSRNQSIKAPPVEHTFHQLMSLTSSSSAQPLTLHSCVLTPEGGHLYIYPKTQSDTVQKDPNLDKGTSVDVLLPGKPPVCFRVARRRTNFSRKLAEEVKKEEIPRPRPQRTAHARANEQLKKQLGNEGRSSSQSKVPPPKPARPSSE